jgi:cellulose synthase/poly-beta-1,6-N-acetylglucosamine synthase-like glycosyltransferase
MGALLYILWSYIALLILAWVLLLFMAVEGIRRKAETMRAPEKPPRILLMVPCKGEDIGLEDNLRSAMRQDYGNYRAIAIVESRSDGAMGAIRKAGIGYMVSGGFRCAKCSGKVRNLAAAIRRFGGYDAYCIMDSDVYAWEGWLSSLARALGKNVGIATSFPIFEPVGGFWSRVKHVWGFVGIGLMENPATRFGWGGSLLFRRELLTGNFREFSESVSDDIPLTNFAKRRRMSIAYVPEARPVVRCDDDRARFFEWSTRQSAFAIRGNRRLLYYGLAFYGANSLLIISAVPLAFYNPLFLALLLPFAIGLARTFRRSGRHALWIIPAYAATSFIYAYNLAIASRTNRITWRGRHYDI